MTAALPVVDGGPLGEGGVAQACVWSRGKRGVCEFGAEVAGARIADHCAWIMVGVEYVADELGEADGGRPPISMTPLIGLGIAASVTAAATSRAAIGWRLAVRSCRKHTIDRSYQLRRDREPPWGAFARDLERVNARDRHRPLVEAVA